MSKDRRKKEIDREMGGWGDEKDRISEYQEIRVSGDKRES
jgi:hypothetical protein